MRRLFIAAAFFAAICSMSGAAEADTKWDVSTGMDYSAGRYGALSDTAVLSAPLNLRVQMDDTRIEASLPYLRVKGPGSFTGGLVVDNSNTITSRSGLGDATLGAAWLWHRDDDEAPSMELAGAIKIPTAAANLGTGKFDYSAQLNLNHSISPQIMVFSSLGYQWLSDFRGYDLEDGFMGSAGVNFRPSDNTGVGVAGNYRQPYFKGLGDQWGVSPYALWTFADHWRITAYGTAGFSRASPRVGGGMRLYFFP